MAVVVKVGETVVNVAVVVKVGEMVVKVAVVIEEVGEVKM